MLVVGSLFAFNAGLSKQEVVECRQWASQAEEFGTAFYLTEWQADQCEAHGIIINATVK